MGLLEVCKRKAEALATSVSIDDVVFEHLQSHRESIVRDAAFVEALGLAVGQLAEDVSNQVLVGILRHLYSDEMNPPLLCRRPWHSRTQRSIRWRSLQARIESEFGVRPRRSASRFRCSFAAPWSVL